MLLFGLVSLLGCACAALGGLFGDIYAVDWGGARWVLVFYT